MKQLTLMGLGLTAATIFFPLFGGKVSLISNGVAAVGWVIAITCLLFVRER